MSRKIQLLSEDVIGKISAGEVVERPASAVKELIENSIDAGADEINIEVQGAGSKLIRIADNGEGMTEEDAKLACARHATSKLNNIADLDSLNTLGFRGEALASIAAVSRLEITTSNSNDGQAVYLYFENGQLAMSKPAARQKGLTIEIKDLFYNVPARKKFLKKESTEFASIVDVVGRFIVSYLDRGFKLTNDSRTIFNINKDMDFYDRATIVMGRDVAETMMEVDYDTGKYRIAGYISRPASTRKDKRQQMFFVNNRYVKSQLISSSLQDSYKSLLERGRYPSCALFVDIDPSKVDVNVHPSKLLVKFEEESKIKEAIELTVKNAFENIKVLGSEAQNIGQEKAECIIDEQVFPSTLESQDEFVYDIPEKSSDNTHKGLLYTPSGRDNENDIVGGNDKIFQVGNCYIIEINNDNIVVTDQHAAHERIFYEYFTKKVKHGRGEVQSLLFPIQLDLSAAESLYMSKVMDSFKTLGFEINNFGGNAYVIHTAPAILKDRDVKDVVYDILSDLMASINTNINVVEEMIKYASCRAAIKQGDPLMSKEMKELLAQLKQCDLPFTCPHGRPTSFEITMDELEKRFRRK